MRASPWIHNTYHYGVIRDGTLVFMKDHGVVVYDANAKNKPRKKTKVPIKHTSLRRRGEYTPTNEDLLRLHDAIHFRPVNAEKRSPGDEAREKYQRLINFYTRHETLLQLWKEEWRASRSGEEVIKKHPYMN